MKLIDPSVRIVEYKHTIESMFSSMMESAFICYQTNPDTAKLSPKEFIDKVIIPNDHGRVLEFGTVYLKIPWCNTYRDTQVVSLFRNNQWSRVMFFGMNHDDPCWLITTNYRVIVDHKLYDEFEKYWCYTNHHPKRYTAEFVLSRGAGDDFRTHVGLSSIMESSRYCNYSKDKFNNELSFIDPYWKDNTEQYEFTLDSFKQEESFYLKGATELKMEPQQLKRIYHLGAKVCLRLCGFKDSWDNFFYRRCDSHADPECQILATTLKELMNN